MRHSQQIFNFRLHSFITLPSAAFFPRAFLRHRSPGPSPLQKKSQRSGASLCNRSEAFSVAPLSEGPRGSKQSAPALIVSSVRGSKASRSRSHHAQLEHHRRLWEGAAIMTEQTAEQVREKLSTVSRSESRRTWPADRAARGFRSGRGRVARCLPCCARAMAKGGLAFGSPRFAKFRWAGSRPSTRSGATSRLV
jgi:hypothetical protein